MFLVGNGRVRKGLEYVIHVEISKKDELVCLNFYISTFHKDPLRPSWYLKHSIKMFQNQLDKTKSLPNFHHQVGWEAHATWLGLICPATMGPMSRPLAGLGVVSALRPSRWVRQAAMLWVDFWDNRIYLVVILLYPYLWMLLSTEYNIIL